MSFRINYENYSRDELPRLTTELIGHFGIDNNFRYCAGLSQMKYYRPPKNFYNLDYDLSVDFIPFAFSPYKPDTYPKLDYILKWITDNFKQLERPLSYQERWLNVNFICCRGLLKTLLCSPYSVPGYHSGWIICASKYGDTIYLCDYYTEEEMKKIANETEEDKLRAFSGHSFERYMVTDHPSHQSDTLASPNEHTEFHCVFDTKFGPHSLLYSAEIDGIHSQQLITDTIVGKAVELIELKTIQVHNKCTDLYGKLNPRRVIEWWAQNYLVNINKIICGLKDGLIVKMIKEYSTHLVPSLSKHRHCNVDKCKMFCKLFLDNAQRIVTKDYKECMYKFYWDPATKNTIYYSEIAPDHKIYSFLKPWFIEEAEKYKKTQLVRAT